VRVGLAHSKFGICFGKRFAGEALELAADQVCGKTRGEKRAVDRGEFPFVDFTSEGAKFAFDTLADDGDLVLRCGRFVDGLVDMAIGNTTGAEVARNAEFALFADF